MIRGRENRGASGSTLVEMLVSIGIMNVIIVLCGISFAEIVRLRGARDAYYERLASAEHVFHSVERDVRNAREIAGAEDNKLILRHKTGEVVYLVTEGQLKRIEKSGENTREEVVANEPGLHVHFDLEGHSPQDARSVATTVEWDEKPVIGVSHPVLSLRVALGEGGQPL